MSARILTIQDGASIVGVRFAGVEIVRVDDPGGVSTNYRADTYPYFLVSTPEDSERRIERTDLARVAELLRNLAVS